MLKYTRTYITILCAGLFIALSLVLRRHAPAPSFAGAFAALGLGGMLLCAAIPNRVLQYLGIVLFAICLALSGGELYLHFAVKKEASAPEVIRVESGPEQAESATNAAKEYAESGSRAAPAPKPARLEASASGAMPGTMVDAADKSYRKYTEHGKNARPTVSSPVTGYAPRPDSAVRAVEVKKGRLVYDVVYTINKEGRRITPHHPEAEEAVVFFGCSYTFGDAINDRETIPWQTGEKLGKHYQTFNFAFSGYGPHQFLALLESGALDSIAARYKKTHVFFLALAGHEHRAAGYWNWYADAPCYELRDGKAEHLGTFAQKSGGSKRRVDAFFQKSLVYALFFTTAHALDNEASLALQTGIFQAAAERTADCEGADFTVLLWPGAEYNEPVLKARGIRVLRLEEAFPGDYHANKEACWIVPGEGHPNANANALVAEHIARCLTAE